MNNKTKERKLKTLEKQRQFFLKDIEYICSNSKISDEVKEKYKLSTLVTIARIDDEINNIKNS